MRRPATTTLSAILLLFALGSQNTCHARRWRFAAPFPGKTENAMPEPVLHKPFEDLAEREKIFDTQEMSKVQKPKLVERVAIDTEIDSVEKDAKTTTPSRKPLNYMGL